MTSKTVKRILWELKDYEKNKEENNKNGIYLEYDEADIYKLDLDTPNPLALIHLALGALNFNPPTSVVSL